MTNPATPPAPPSPGGGMPKWLIILLVFFLFLGVGCCGGFVLCSYVFKRAGSAAQSAFEREQASLAKLAQDNQARMTEARKQAEAAGAAPGAVTPADAGNPLGAPGDTPAPAQPANTDTPAVVASKIPDNFPTDIPVYSGFTPTFSMADNLKGAGSVIFSSTESVATIGGYYDKQMADKGWKVEQNVSIGEGRTVVYSKGAYKATMTIAPDGKRTEASIVYEKQ